MRIAAILVTYLFTGLMGYAATAQPVFTRAHIVASLTHTGTSSHADATSLDGLQTLADLSGPARTWGFTAVPFGPLNVSETRPATLPAPGSDNPHLATATYVQRVGRADSTAFAYYHVSDSAVETLGITGEVDFEGTPAPFTLLF